MFGGAYQPSAPQNAMLVRGVVMGWSLVTSVAARPRFGKLVLSCPTIGFEMLLAAYTFPTRKPAIHKTSGFFGCGPGTIPSLSDGLGFQVEIWQSVFKPDLGTYHVEVTSTLLLVRSLLQVFSPQYLS